MNIKGQKTSGNIEKSEKRGELALSVKLMKKHIHHTEENNTYDPRPTAATPKKGAATTAQKQRADTTRYIVVLFWGYGV